MADLNLDISVEYHNEKPHFMSSDGREYFFGCMLEKVSTEAIAQWNFPEESYFFDFAPPRVELLDDADMGVMKTTYYVTADETVDEDTTWYAYTGKMPAYIDANGDACQAGDDGAQPVLHNKTEVAYVDADHMGYSDSDYVLTVTVQTVQATQEAVNHMFAGSAETEFTAPEGCSWELK